MRAGGVLMHISSLPSPYGIGSLGKPSFEFVDFLEAAGQKYWQILPICPTGYGDSPYQSFSTFAGNPYFIDFETLENEGLLTADEYRKVSLQEDETKVDYGALYTKKYPILRKAADRLMADTPEDFRAFCEENSFWLEDYALFMALKDAHEGRSWTEWEEPLKRRNKEALEEACMQHAKEIAFWKAVQYLFFKQWKSMKEYAAAHGIRIIGDLPIYVSYDSVDVWSDPASFDLDEELKPRSVAGCPPDGFSADGQLWGNPLYNWDAMEKNGFAWWIRRITYQCKVYDILRIDHAQLFEDTFYQQKPVPNMRDNQNTVSVPTGVDPDLVNKVLQNPELLTLLQALGKLN